MKLGVANAQGYAAFQIKNYKFYQSVIIELGEENIFGFTKHMSPLLKFLLYSAVNIVIFVLINSKKDILNVYSDMLGNMNKNDESNGSFMKNGIFGIIGNFAKQFFNNKPETESKQPEKAESNDERVQKSKFLDVLKNMNSNNKNSS